MPRFPDHTLWLYKREAYRPVSLTKGTATFSSLMFGLTAQRNRPSSYTASSYGVTAEK